ncbi:MAG TPA: YceI family protein [Candidatus Kapabacteria bacterium]|jgi:polyisoprenoid-binding protein YceI|nr:YceI family protein [Candidatus Kapabacteria bacterium]HOV91661.1 YceI family protein [Candidatus Kapabacteria bacterium]
MNARILNCLVIAVVLICSTNLIFAQKENVRKLDLKQSYITFTIQTEKGVIESKINFKSGKINYVDTIMKSFEFIADMKNIQITKRDSGLNEQQLVEAVCSPGFFNCDSFPEVRIVDKRIDRKRDNSYFTVANMFIKNKPVELKFVVYFRQIGKNDGFYSISYLDRKSSSLHYIPQPNSLKINDNYFYDNIEILLYIILE